MDQEPTSETITIHTAKETVREIDALADAMNRSRDYIINRAMERYLEINAWQVERIRAGVAAAREGRVRPADAVFGDIAAKHGWMPSDPDGVFRQTAVAPGHDRRGALSGKGS